MNKYLEKFPVSTGLNLQADDLKCWRKVLNDQAFARLQAECIEENKKLTPDSSGYDVFRGDDLMCFVVHMTCEK